MAYFERAFEESYSVIDIVLNCEFGHPVLPPHASEDALVDEMGRMSIPSTNKIDPKHSALFYLWDTFLRYIINKH